MRKVSGFLLVLLLTGQVKAQKFKVLGDTEVKQGGFAVLTVEGAGKTVIWTVSPEPIQDLELAGVLVFTGFPGTPYTATAIVIDFDKKTVEKAKQTVRFSGVPPDNPNPPNPPSDRSDRFLQALQACFDGESVADKALLPNLVGFYQDGLATVDTTRYWSDFWKNTIKFAKDRGISGKLGRVQLFLQAELKESGFPTSVNANQEMTPAEKRMVTDTFAKIISALQKVR